MDRIGGAYKRLAYFSILLISLILVVAFNVDSLKLVHDISSDSTLRQTLVAEAGRVNDPNISPNQVKTVLDELGASIGWGQAITNCRF